MLNKDHGPSETPPNPNRDAPHHPASLATLHPLRARVIRRNLSLDTDTKGMTDSVTRSQLCPLNIRGHTRLTHTPTPQGGASPPPKLPITRGGASGPPVLGPARAPVRAPAPAPAHARTPTAHCPGPGPLIDGPSSWPYQGMALYSLRIE